MSAIAESGDDTTEEQDLAALQAVADVAPSEISDEMDQLLDVYEQLQAFDPEASSEEEMGEFLAIVGQLEEFAMENCPDLPADFFSTE